MSAIALVHLGRKLPEHLKYCIAQSRRWSPTIPIHLLCDRSVVRAANDSLRMHDIEVHDLQAYRRTELWLEFKEIRDFYPKRRWWDPRRWDPRQISNPVPVEFWRYSTERLFALHAFLDENSLTEVFHFENDVLIFTDLQRLAPAVSRLYSHLAITPLSDTAVTTGMLYIKDPSSLEHLCSSILEQLVTGSTRQTVETYGGMVNDMTLMHDYRMRHGPENLGLLPILPRGPYSDGARDLGGIFDPASWGQYVDGTPTPHNQPPGFTDREHFIGKELLGKRHEIIWRNTNGSHGEPFVVTDDTTTTKLMTLHVHSKRLERYALVPRDGRS